MSNSYKPCLRREVRCHDSVASLLSRRWKVKKGIAYHSNLRFSPHEASLSLSLEAVFLEWGDFPPPAALLPPLVLPAFGLIGFGVPARHKGHAHGPAGSWGQGPRSGRISARVTRIHTYAHREHKVHTRGETHEAHWPTVKKLL